MLGFASASADTIAPTTGCEPVAVISTTVPDTLRRPGAEGIGDDVKFALDTSPRSIVKSPEMIAEAAHCWTYPSLFNWTHTCAFPGRPAS
jgi:hypothetical protein